MAGASWHRVMLAMIAISLTSSAGTSSPIPEIKVEIAITPSGTPTDEWLEAIRPRIPPDELTRIRISSRPFSTEERAWLDLIQADIPRWKLSLPKLIEPFEDVPPPDRVTVLFGNQGGNDGFTNGTNRLCIDVGDWVRQYGPPQLSRDAGDGLRILSHEFTHLMTRAWRKNHPVNLSTPVCRALWQMYHEGMGNLRSLTSRWYTPENGLGEIAHKTPEELSPVLVDRLLKLQAAPPEEEETLMQGLSKGPFKNNWGALPVALWLAAVALSSGAG